MDYWYILHSIDNKEFPYLCQRFYDYPDEKLSMIGVTGTDGKTTTATVVSKIIDNCAYIGTNGFVVFLQKGKYWVL